MSDEDYSKVTRVVLVSNINNAGMGMSAPVVERWADSWEMVLQDDGRTLKLFAKGTGHEAHKVAQDNLAQDFSEVDPDLIREGYWHI